MTTSLSAEQREVLVVAIDPILRAGVEAALRSRPEFRVCQDEQSADEDTVAVIVADRLDDRVVRRMRALRTAGVVRLVLLSAVLEDSDLLTAVELGVRAVGRRPDVSTEQLLRLVNMAHAGDAALPPELLNRLLTQVARLQRQVLAPQGLNAAGLTEREVAVLRLVSMGLDTREIAKELCYSQRTVKAVLHDVVTRFRLRNRSHAVAYALREGLI